MNEGMACTVLCGKNRPMGLHPYRRSYADRIDRLLQQTENTRAAAKGDGGSSSKAARLKSSQ